MRKIILAALAAGSVMAASPALAQSASGTVNVSGSVASKCTATTPINGTIALNELALSTGLVDPAFTSATLWLNGCENAPALSGL